MTSVRERMPVGDRPCAGHLGQSAGFPLNRLPVPRQVAFWLVAYVFGATILGTSRPAPLYTLWQRHWHFNSGVVTLVFAVCVFAYTGLIIPAVGVRGGRPAERRPV